MKIEVFNIRNAVNEIETAPKAVFLVKTRAQILMVDRFQCVWTNCYLSLGHFFLIEPKRKIKFYRNDGHWKYLHKNLLSRNKLNCEFYSLLLVLRDKMDPEDLECAVCLGEQIFWKISLLSSNFEPQYLRICLVRIMIFS